MPQNARFAELSAFRADLPVFEGFTKLGRRFGKFFNRIGKVGLLCASIAFISLRTPSNTSR